MTSPRIMSHHNGAAQPVYAVQIRRNGDLLAPDGRSPMERKSEIRERCCSLPGRSRIPLRSMRATGRQPSGWQVARME